MTILCCCQRAAKDAQTFLHCFQSCVESLRLVSGQHLSCRSVLTREVVSLNVIVTWANHFFMFSRSAQHDPHRHRHTTWIVSSYISYPCARNECSITRLVRCCLQVQGTCSRCSSQGPSVTGKNRFGMNQGYAVVDNLYKCESLSRTNSHEGNMKYAQVTRVLAPPSRRQAPVERDLQSGARHQNWYLLRRMWQCQRVSRSWHANFLELHIRPLAKRSSAKPATKTCLHLCRSSHG